MTIQNGSMACSSPAAYLYGPADFLALSIVCVEYSGSTLETLDLLLFGCGPVAGSQVVTGPAAWVVAGLLSSLDFERAVYH